MITCSFCDKNDAELAIDTGVMIKGEKAVICSECIDLCNKCIESKPMNKQTLSVDLKVEKLMEDELHRMTDTFVRSARLYADEMSSVNAAMRNLSDTRAKLEKDRAFLIAFAKAAGYEVSEDDAIHGDWNSLITFNKVRND